MIGTYLFMVRLHRLGQRITKYFQSFRDRLRAFFRPTLNQCDIPTYYRHRPVCLSYVAYPAKSAQEEGHHICQFDTDSFKIGVDTMCSRTMSGSKHHFEDLREVPPTKSVDGIGNSALKIAGIGTFVFSLIDDTGELCTVKIPNSLYVPGLRLPLLCPQHWAQTAKDHTPRRMGTFVLNFDHGCQLWWDQAKHCKTILHDKSTNTPTFKTASGTSKYQAFEACFHAMDASHLRHHVELCVPNLRRHTRPPDPAEFTADEDLLTSDLPKDDSECSSDDETVLAGNHDFRLVNPDQPCPIHPTGNHKWGDCSLYRHALTHRMDQLHYSPIQSVSEADEQDATTHATDDQAELMRWHHRLAHLYFKDLKILAEQGDIPRKLANVSPPKCAGCLFGAMTKQRTRDKGEKRSIFTATKPGEVVSVDTMQSNELGFIAQAKGTLTTHRYKYATIFVDHFSRLRFIHLHRSNTSAEIVQAKHAFERFSYDHGVSIKQYHCDNGRFADKGFIAACEAKGQRISFCGVNAHFQNGIAEKAIRDITEAARKILLHAKVRWPHAIDLALWPYAMRYAVHIHNTVAVIEGKSRIELFSGTDVGSNMKHNHTFGCPVFALQNALASGGTLPKWSPRARLGINLGPSPNHARNVNLVLNLSTGLVSPQFHCRFDDFFETTRYGAQDVATTAPWRTLAGFRRPDGSPAANHVDVSPNTDREQPIGTFDFSDASEEFMDPSESVTTHAPPADRTSGSSPAQASEGGTTSEGANPTAGVSSRGRSRKMSRAMADSVSQRDFYGSSNMHYMAHLSVLSDDELHDQHLELQERMRSPIAFHAEMMGDIMYYHQAMKQPDASEFANACVKEVNGHIQAKRWKVIHRSKVPDGIDVLPSVWSMRRKRNLTTNEVTKHKARLNIHGGKQTFGMNYFDTYAPVVTWFAIRIVMVLALLYGYALRQIDFIQAYPQAPIEQDMYMELPLGFESAHGNSKDHVLQLLSNLYGQKQAGRVWNNYMVTKLLDIGFEQSLVDECLFYKGDIIFIVYTDDGIFMGKDDAQLTDIIKQLKAAKLDVEDQGHPADYVGVNIRKLRDGTVEFSQRALIDNIINDANDDAKYTKPVPAKSSVILHAHKDSPDFEGAFGYRSMVGKLNYLAQTTRPDILYAVHQVAKYSSCPKKEHGDAILYIVRYLKRTRDIGLRFKPDPSKGFEDYCDADFSGNWNREFAETDPSIAKSRSGWIVFYAGCPIIFA